jgi:hypothetical protein
MQTFTLDFHDAVAAREALNGRPDLYKRFLILNDFVVITPDELAHDDVVQCLIEAGIYPEGCAEIYVSPLGTIDLI